MSPAQMTDLTNRVVARYQDELAEADQLVTDWTTVDTSMPTRPNPSGGAS